ncbi:GntR family transcriptional regulator [Priestia flexa]|uniref:GntR family transcriptional regulator n=2 Tax=Priestia TaxID=2800373 RepID=A0A0V8JJ38_9BACI|nr:MULTISPECIES: GntR family transcriptional regulator [Bacillaceae]KSU86688.1 GntR family transcriptional regulator [Priestia veravalensis]KZB91953.1 GntR family transcriptional regulator [Bacillus sp. VT 712]MBN8433290.1 GntR family transcriptional regulator [Priestia flexa]MBY6086549.1 GntR family transcriptional regulator [Priestia flexa]MCA0965816.1 GntR family transcriptional regulator [Priestia flexa]
MKRELIKPIKRLSLREEIYQTLKQGIITLEFPPDQRLNDKELAEKFSVSRTPVREALKRLEDEGLVESIPGSITKVSSLNPEEAKHAFTVVAVLHALATKLAVAHLTEEDFKALAHHNAALQSAVEKHDIIGAIEADQAFHRVFLEAANNPEILLALERSESKIYRLEVAKFSSEKGFKSVSEHKGIIEVCQSQEPLQAANLVEKNWLSLGELLA